VALALERVDDVHGGDGLAARVLGVGDGVADDVLEEDLEHAAGLLVDEPRDALDAAPPGQPPDRRLGDPLDVVAERLPCPDPCRPCHAQTSPQLLLSHKGRRDLNRTNWGFWLGSEGIGVGRGRYVEEGDEWAAVGLDGIKPSDAGRFALIGGGAGVRIGGGVAFGCGARGEVENHEGIVWFPPFQLEKGNFLFGDVGALPGIGFGSV
jgi:hypothetical protein